MRTNRFSNTRPLTRVVAAAGAVGSASLLLVGALQAPAGAVVSAPYKTTTVVTASPGNAFTGQSVTFSAKVGAGSHGTPGGTVTFSGVGCSGGNAVAVAGGVATCTVSGGLVASSSPYSVSATYADTVDSTYLPSTGIRSETVNFGKSTTTVTSSANPSVTGRGVSFTAAVLGVAPAVGTPTGTVTFAGVTCDGGTNAIPLAGGLAQCAVAGGLSAQSGPIVVTGAYSGDSGFSSSSNSVKQMVGQAASTVALAASPDNCTGDICTVGLGTSVAFTATAASTGADGGTGTPTGTMTFSVVRAGSKASLTCDGGTNTIALVGGQATCTLAGGLAASVYFTVTATLSSSGYAAPSATVYENSMLAGTSTTVSMPHALGAGQSFTVVATVTPIGSTGSNVPTGFVNVLVCGGNSNGNNGCQGGAAPVGPGGVAQFLVGGGEYPGGYTVSAVYTGDDNFYTSMAHARTFFVGLSSTSLNLSQYGGFVTVTGQAATVTATVVTPDGAAGSTLVGPMTGTITFSITDPNGNPVNCGSGNVVPLAVSPGQVEGTATCFLPPGSLTTTSPNGSAYAIHANYGGDSDYGVSNASAKEIVVPAIA